MRYSPKLREVLWHCWFIITIVVSLLLSHHSFSRNPNNLPAKHFEKVNHHYKQNRDLSPAHPIYFDHKPFHAVVDSQTLRLQLTTQNLLFPSYSEDISKDCPGSFDLRFSITGNCSKISIVEIDLQLEHPYESEWIQLDTVITDSVLQISGTGIPIGQHSAIISIKDECDHLATIKVVFSIIDKKAPTPICINGLVVLLLPVDANGDGKPETGMAEIFPETILASTQLADCSGPVSLSLAPLDDAPDIERKKIIFTCADPLLETLPIRIYAWDNAGNYAFCETFIILEDKSGACQNVHEVKVSGLVFTEEDEAIEAVNMNVLGNNLMIGKTNETGLFQFPNLPPGYDYTIKPNKNNDPINGVTTFDLVLISKHILRVRLLDSPYKMIAADANNSGTITTLDLIQLRRLILRMDENLRENTSWRFIPASYEFPDPQNPWKEKWPEIANLNNLLLSFEACDFIGIKIGDVNGSVKSNSHQPGYRSSLNEPIMLEYEGRSFEKNESFVTAFYLNSPIDPLGIQFTFEFDKDILEIDHVESPDFKDFMAAMFLDDGKFTGIWYQSNEMILPTKPVFFKITFRTKQKGNLQNLLKLTSSKTPAEVYSEDGSIHGIMLKNTTPLTPANELFGNWPNPFTDLTNVSFYTQTEENGLIQLISMSGHVIRQYPVQTQKGMNHLQIAGLNPGVYILSITIGNWTRSIRLVATR
jgi:hypothetical protein